MNPFKFSFDNKRYHTLAYHNRANFCKTYKAALNVGLSCPNIDGTKAFGGCIFCSENSSYFAADKNLGIIEQLELEYLRISKKYKDPQLTAYFQSGSNTHTTASHLYTMLKSAASFPHVKNISIATRADCLKDEILSTLYEMSKVLPITVELGLQSSNDDTARLINRAHDFKDFEIAVKKLHHAKIRVCAHIINGLPKETKDDMLKTAKDLAILNIDALKIHLLHVSKGTKLATLYQDGKYTPLTLKEYVDIVVSQLEVLPPKTVIERITGDGDKRTLLAPLWSKDKIRVLGSIDVEMAKRNTWQGKLLTES